MKNKIFLPLLLAFTSIAILKPCFATRPPELNATKDIVLFDAGAVAITSDDMATNLAAALQKYSEIKKFRTDWDYSVGGGSGAGAVLYDRKLKTLKIYKRNYDEKGVSTSLFTYQEVTDELLQKISNHLQTLPENSGAEVMREDIFAELLRMGCPRVGYSRYKKWDIVKR